jgi:CRP-like cAMP-binding protein
VIGWRPVSTYGIVERFADGEVIIREGDAGREMYVIQRGSVEVLRSIGGRTVVFATLERGGFFGEDGALLESEPRNATVRAIGDVDLLVIGPGALLLKIRRDPTFAFELLQHMSQRLRNLDEQLIGVLNEANLSTTAELRSILKAKINSPVPSEAAEPAM